MARVFISYSRKDGAVVRRLYDALTQRSVESWVDWEGIPPADDWLRKIRSAIEGADTFVFVMSPDALESTVCAEEVAHAVAHHKRLVPVVVRDAQPGGAPIPEALRRLNWVFLRPADEFDASVDRLVAAVRTDLAWVESHTRLLGRAIEWDAAHRDDSFVLQKLDLAAAEQWLARGPDKDPKPTALQSEYILASRQVAMRRQRRLTAAALVAVVLVGLGAVVATVQYVRAEIRREQGLSQQLAAQSAAAMEDDPSLGLLLAVHAHDAAPTLEAADALLSALERVRGVRAFLHDDYLPGTLALSADGALMAAGRCTAGAADGDCAQTGLELWRLDATAPRRVGSVPFEPGDWPLDVAVEGRRLRVAMAGEEGKATRALLYRLTDDPAAAGGLLAVRDAEQPVVEGQTTDARAAPGNPASIATETQLASRIRRAAGVKADIGVLPAAHPAAARALATVARGDMSDPVQVQLWDTSGAVPRLRTQATLSSHVWGQTKIRPDGRVAAASGCALAASGRICDEGQLVILDDTGDGPRATVIARHLPDWIRALAVLPAGEALVLSGGCGRYSYQNCREGELRLWNVHQDGGVLGAFAPLPTSGGAVESIALSGDGRSLGLVSQRGRASLWDLRGLTSVDAGWLASGLAADADEAARASPAGAGAAGADAASDAASSASATAPAAGAAAASRPAPVACNGKAVGDPDLQRVARQLASPSALCAATALAGEWTSAVADADGRRLALAGCGAGQGRDCTAGRTMVWHVADGRLAERVILDTPAPVTALAFSPDGDRLALASCSHDNPQECSDARLELVDLARSDAPRRTLAEGVRLIQSLAFHPSADALAYGTCARLEDTGAVRACALGSVRLLALGPSAQALERTLAAHPAAVTALAIASDGTLMASGGGDDSLALWDLRRGTRLGPVVAGAAGTGSALRFTSDGVLASWFEGSERFWHAAPARWSEVACRIANRRLGDAEYARFLPGEPPRDACARPLSPRGSALWRWMRTLAG